MALLDNINSLFTSFSNILPYHLLSLSTLIGSQLYQSFIVTKIAYDALPRTAFTSLQKKLFPVYFGTQAVLLLATLATAPPRGLFSITQKKGTWIPLLLAVVPTGLNYFVFGPRTRQLMIDRIHQVTKDSVSTADSSAEPTPQMMALNKAFSRAHAMSIHLNLISMGAIVFYCCNLSGHLQYVA